MVGLVVAKRTNRLRKPFTFMILTNWKTFKQLGLFDKSIEFLVSTLWLHRFHHRFHHRLAHYKTLLVGPHWQNTAYQTTDEYRRKTYALDE